MALYKLMQEEDEEIRGFGVYGARTHFRDFAKLPQSRHNTAVNCALTAIRANGRHAAFAQNYAVSVSEFVRTVTVAALSSKALYASECAGAVLRARIMLDRFNNLTGPIENLNRRAFRSRAAVRVIDRVIHFAVPYRR